MYATLHRCHGIVSGTPLLNVFHQHELQREKPALCLVECLGPEEYQLNAQMQFVSLMCGNSHVYGCPYLCCNQLIGTVVM